MKGWIKLHRQIVESAIWTAERFSKGQAWVDLLLLANHKPQTIFIRGIELQVLRGQVAYSQVSLAHRWSWNFKTIVTFLRWLENRDMVETRTNNQTTVITIKNYSTYQTNGEQSGDQNGDQKETRTETDKNVKNEKYMSLGKKPPPDPTIKIFINYAYQTFLATKGKKLHITEGKDGKTIKSLLGTYDIEELKTLWDKFLSSKDEFILKAGFSIGIFKTQVNKLLLEKKDWRT